MNTAQALRSDDHRATDPMIAAMQAAFDEDLDAFLEATKEARTFLHPRHDSRPLLNRADQMMLDSRPRAAWNMVRQAQIELVTTFPVDPSLLPPVPGTPLCECGERIWPNANFCTKCGTRVSS